MKDLIKTVLRDFHKKGIPSFKRRDLELPLNSGKIITLIGPRRSGKTYMMYQTMSKIEDISNIIYIDFEDERLNLKASDLNMIIEAYFELYPEKKEDKIYFFFDEIQEVEDWERFVRRIYNTLSKKIFITGSSSKLLSKEIATSLRGRTISFEIYPLSFKEYLDFKNIEKDVYSTKGKSKLVSMFEQYMRRGGFPELIGMDNEFAERTLRTYFEVMLYRDVVERHNITNTTALKLFIKKLLANMSREFSINKIFNELKSQGIRISKDAIYLYLDYCSDAFILLPISEFSESVSKQITRKIYSIDIGLSLIVSFSLSKDKGRILENVVLLELKRRNKEIYFHKGRYECDFLVKEKEQIKNAIQVCYNLDEDNKEREILGLKEAMKRFRLKKGLILTLNQQGEVGDIKIIPAWKWLLGYE